MGILEERLQGKSLADYTNTQLRLALGAVLYTNTADMWKQYLNQLGYSGDVSQMLQKYYVDYNIPAVFRNYVNAGAGIYSPQQLFQDGSVGVLYDNNDLSTLFSDSAGTTAAVVNGPVGLQLDKSQGLVLGAELVTNGNFSSGSTGWTLGSWTVSGGVASCISDSTSLINQFTSVSGKWYRVEFDVVSHTSGILVVAIGQNYSGQVVFSGVDAAPGRKSVLIQSGPTTSRGVEFFGGTVTCSIDNVSVKELLGNHRYQSTTGFKPVLRGTPTGSELFAAYGTPGAGWSVAGATGTATTASSALPTTTASVVGKFYRVTYTVTRSAGSVQMSFGGRTGASRSAAGQYVEYFDNTTNTNVLTATGTSFTGTVRIDEVKDVSAGSVTAPYGLQYDGQHDFLQTASVDFSATDKMFVCAGVRKLSDAAQGVIVELSASAISNNGSFAIVAPSSGGVPNYVYASKGTTSVVSAVSALSFAAPITNVLSGISEIASDTCLVRVNGVQSGFSSSDQGTGNYGNYAIYFGRRGGTSDPYNGLDFGFVIVGKTLTAAQISSTERWMAQRTGVSI